MNEIKLHPLGGSKRLLFPIDTCLTGEPHASPGNEGNVHESFGLARREAREGANDIMKNLLRILHAAKRVPLIITFQQGIEKFPDPALYLPNGDLDLKHLG